MSDVSDPSTSPAPYHSPSSTGRIPFAWELWAVLVIEAVLAVSNTPRLLRTAPVDVGQTGVLVGIVIVAIIPLYGLFKKWRWAWWWFVIWLGTLPIVQILYACIEGWSLANVPA